MVVVFSLSISTGPQAGRFFDTEIFLSMLLPTMSLIADLGLNLTVAPPGAMLCLWCYGLGYPSLSENCCVCLQQDNFLAEYSLVL